MTKNSHLLKLTVSEKEAGMRLDAFLRERLDQKHSGKKIKKGIDQYGCRVNGKIELFSATKVKTDDVIEFDLSKFEPRVIQPLKILYEDNDFWVIDKPAFALSDNETLRKELKHACYLVHRIDQQTSGLMIVGKHLNIQKAFEELFRKREVFKTYLALADGSLPQKKLSVQNYLGKIASYEGQAIWGAVSEDKGAFALTHIELIEKKGKISFLKCMPETGRTHQIRVHLSGLGCPILGDHHYAREHSFHVAAARTMLHAYQLEFKHPLSGKPMKFIAPIPEDFIEKLTDLGINYSQFKAFKKAVLE